MNEILDCKNCTDVHLKNRLEDFISDIRQIFGDTSDLNVTRFNISDTQMVVLTLEAMVSTSFITDLIFRPLTGLMFREVSKKEISQFIRYDSLIALDRQILDKYGDIVVRLSSGFAVIAIDGENEVVALGVQGFAQRSVEEPSTQVNVKGAHEGFVENIRTNMSLVRRRIKDGSLRFESMKIGSRGKIDICIAYIYGKAQKNLLNEVKKRLSSVNSEIVLTSGSIQSFVDGKRKSLFSGSAFTERPDILCSKLIEGRIGILIDGIPFAVTVPSLFIENFQAVDDYSENRVFAAAQRWLRYLAFVLSVFLPCIHVAAVTFHPSVLPKMLIYNIASASQSTPMSVMLELIIMTVLFEILRDAGIRLPKAVGTAVSIVGALVIGDAAVTSGLISAPILIIIGITETSAFVVPSLNAQISILRFAGILLGGIFGFFGVAVLVIFIFSSLCSTENMGVPYFAPVSPFSRWAMGDIAYMKNPKKKNGPQKVLQDMTGTESMD